MPAMSVTCAFVEPVPLYRRPAARARVSLAAAVVRSGARQTGTSSVRCRRMNSRQKRPGRAGSRSETIGSIRKSISGFSGINLQRNQRIRQHQSTCPLRQLTPENTTVHFLRRRRITQFCTRRPESSRRDPGEAFGGEGGMGASRPGMRLAPLRPSNRLRKPIPHSAGKQNGPRKGAHFCFLAERVGFEPTVRCNRTPDFESGPFDHSGTSPRGGDIGEQSGRCQVPIRPVAVR